MVSIALIGFLLLLSQLLLLFVLLVLAQFADRVLVIVLP